MRNYSGPLTLIRSYGKEGISERVLDEAKKLTSYYSTKSRGKDDVLYKVKIV